MTVLTGALFVWTIFLGLVWLIIGLGPAYAQDHYTLTLTDTQLNLVGKGLGKLPFEDVAPTINNIMQQVQEQQKAAKAQADATKEQAK